MNESLTDLGSKHKLYYARWSPDRELNPQYGQDVPDVERYCAIILHLTPEGKPCQSCITFDSPTSQRVSPKAHKWTVESWEPLTVSPSILCGCGDHGFIHEGRWKVA